MRLPKRLNLCKLRHKSVIEVVEAQIAFGNSYLVDSQCSNVLATYSMVGLLTLPPYLVQKVNHDLALNYPHTVEVFPRRVRKLFLALPSFFLPPSHRWRHFPNR
jgi:hypothetical protein